MKKIIKLTIILIPIFCINYYSQQFSYNHDIYIANWNVENLYDTEDDPIKNDNEFLPNGKKEWTESKLETKLNNLKKVIEYMNDGNGPDILALQEVENINVLKRLLYKLNFRDYVPVYRESPDERGIDVTLIYDRKVFRVISANSINVKLPGGDKTRDILYVKLCHLRSKKILHVFVNHFPSRSGGKSQSEIKRIIAAKILKEKIDSLFSLNNKENIIVLGDFNDEPDDISIKEILDVEDFDCNMKINLEGRLLNLSYKDFKSGKGTYLFRNDWNMLDQIIISSSLIDKKNLDYMCSSFEIIQPDFMFEKSEKRKRAPVPTFLGNKYIGGFSDHYPVVAKFTFFKERE